MSMLKIADQEEKFGAMSKMMQDNPTYAGMVQSVDESVGRIMEQLKALGIAERTIVIFTSDNGGLSTLPARRKSPTSVAPLRAGKGWLYEGGIRVPAIIKWPSTTEPCSTCDVPISSIDFYPTIMDIIGFPMNKSNPIDGASLKPLLKQGKITERNLFWHYPHYHGSNNRPSAAIRSGDFKLIEWVEDGKLELFNLSNDLGEREDLSTKDPEKTNALKEILHDWQNQIQAQMASPNPEYRQ